MKNLLVLALIVLCSIWLLWIKLHQTTPVDADVVSNSRQVATATSKPQTASEVHQALSGLIRVFESRLTLDNLIPITTALNTELPRISLADRYRIYTQLEQALSAYTDQLNSEQADMLERYAALHSQLSQQIEPQPLELQQQEDAQPQSGDTNSNINDAANIDADAAKVSASDATDQPSASSELDSANPATQQTEPQQPTPPNRQITQATFEQQWPQFLRQGLSSKQRQLLDALAKQQIEIAYAGEGSFAFRLNPNYWVEHIAPHLPKADQVYLKQVAEQTQQPYADDAGLLISWLELGQRVQVWAQYVQDHPDGYFTEMAQANRDDNLNTLLVGMDNTPTHEQGVLLPEVKAAYAQLIQQYPNSQLSKTLSLFEQQLAERPDDVPAAARRAIALAKDQISR